MEFRTKKGYGNSEQIKDMEIPDKKYGRESK